MVELTEAEKAEQRRATYAVFDDAQALTGLRAAVLTSGTVTYGPGSDDKVSARMLGWRRKTGRPFTLRQVDVAAYLAWRYREQILASLVPAEPVSKP